MVLIYALTCTANGKAYIGCTAGNIAKRFREHRCLLENGKHNEADLQSDWAAFGSGSFQMETVFILEDDASLHAKRAMETFAMKRYKALGLLYNRNEASFAPTREAIMKSASMSVNLGRKQSEESKLARSIAQTGISHGHGWKISATKKRLGQKPSLEAARLGGLAATAKRYKTMR